MTTVLLVRHGHVDPAAGTQAADPPLSADGHRQAETTARAFTAGLFGSLDAVVTSTMRRARETAAPLAAALDLTPSPDERLVELDHGWTSYGTGGHLYQTRAAMYEALSAGRWGPDRFDPTAFADRVQAAVDDVVAAHPAGTVAVVCHGGVVSAYLSRVLGVERVVFFIPDNCSVTRVLAEPDGYSELLSANETLHLRLPEPWPGQELPGASAVADDRPDDLA